MSEPRPPADIQRQIDEFNRAEAARMTTRPAKEKVVELKRVCNTDFIIRIARLLGIEIETGGNHPLGLKHEDDKGNVSRFPLPDHHEDLSKGVTRGAYKWMEEHGTVPKGYRLKISH